jgi:hypothetical protein
VVSRAEHVQRGSGAGTWRGKVALESGRCACTCGSSQVKSIERTELEDEDLEGEDDEEGRQVHRETDEHTRYAKHHECDDETQVDEAAHSEARSQQITRRASQRITADHRCHAACRGVAPRLRGYCGLYATMR